MLGFFGHRFQIRIKPPIVHFWDTSYKTDRSKFGFYDAYGHVYTKKKMLCQIIQSQNSTFKLYSPIFGFIFTFSI